MSAGAGLLAAALNRFLVFGIFTNLAIIKAIKMFSLLCVIWTIWEVSQMIRCLLTSRYRLLDRSWKWLFLNDIVSHRRENLCFLLPLKLLLFKKTDTFFYRSTVYLLNAEVLLISLRSKYYFSFFLDMKIWASCACILNSKSPAPGPIWLKFRQIVVR